MTNKKESQKDNLKDNLFDLVILPVLIFILITAIVFIFRLNLGSPFGGDLIGIFFGAGSGRLVDALSLETLKACFLSSEGMYRPLSSYISSILAALSNQQYPIFHLLNIFILASLNGLLALLVFKIVQVYSKSTQTSIITTFLFIFSIPSITSSWYQFFGVSQLPTIICVCLAIYAYLKYKDKKESKWVFLYIVFTLIGPWLRQYGSLPALIIIVNEVFTQKRKKIDWVFLLVSTLMSLHGIFPTVVVKLIGLYQGEIKSIFSQDAMTASLVLHGGINWARFGILFASFSPILWVLVVFLVVTWLTLNGNYNQNMMRITEEEVKLDSKFNYASLFSVFVRSIGKYYINLKITIAIGVVAALIASFSVVFSNDTPDTFWQAFPVITFFLFVCLVTSLRFGIFVPIWLITATMPILKSLVNAEIHNVYVMMPIAITIGLWVGKLNIFKSIENQKDKLLNFVTVGILFLSLADQFQNVPSAYFTQKRLIDGHREIVSWIENNVEQGSAILGNFFPMIEIIKPLSESKSIQGYWIVENSPINQSPKYPTIHKYEDQTDKINEISNNGKSVYYLLLYSENSDGQYLLPRAELKELKKFRVKGKYLFIDPIKHFVGYPISYQFLGYADWLSSYETLPVNGKGFFNRSWQADFIFYKLVKLYDIPGKKIKVDMYGKSTTTIPNKSIPEVSESIPKLIEEGYNGFNIVAYQGKFYALAQDIGPIDLDKTEDKILIDYQKRGKYFVGESLEGTKKLIDQQQK